MGFSINLSRVSLRPAGHSVVYSYEFMDIVMDSPQSELEKRRIYRYSPAWVLILNEVNCLLCSGLGDSIVGKCSLSLMSRCNRLPKGSNLMASTMQSIKRLSIKHGGGMESGAHMLTTKHYLLLTGDPFPTM
jgi:hypothetical protein